VERARGHRQPHRLRPAQHSEFSGKDLSYYDGERDERYLPYVIEPAAGVDRSALAFLVDAYREEEAPTAKGGTEKRTVLKLHHALAPGEGGGAAAVAQRQARADRA
jgi:glycyl-tRNA synthetase (class II)